MQWEGGKGNCTTGNTHLNQSTCSLKNSLQPRDGHAIPHHGKGESYLQIKYVYMDALVIRKLALNTRSSSTACFERRELPRTRPSHHLNRCHSRFLFSTNPVLRGRTPVPTRAPLSKRVIHVGQLVVSRMEHLEQSRVCQCLRRVAESQYVL